jgi:hypothetical protein
MTMSWALPPRNAIFSGYTMGYDYFQKLVLALSPDFTTICREDGPQPFEMYVCEYDVWRMRLPEEELEKAPILKGMQNGSAPGDKPRSPTAPLSFQFQLEGRP